MLKLTTVRLPLYSGEIEKNLFISISACAVVSKTAVSKFLSLKVLFLSENSPDFINKSSPDFTGFINPWRNILL